MKLSEYMDGIILSANDVVATVLFVDADEDKAELIFREAENEKKFDDYWQGLCKRDLEKREQNRTQGKEAV